MAQLLPLMQASRQGYALFDNHEKLRFANQAFRKTLGLARSDLPSWADIMRQAYGQAVGLAIEVTPDDFEIWLQAAQSRRGRMPYRTIESRLKDGRWMLMTETTQSNGWILCVTTDISELGDDWRRLREERDATLRAIQTDEITGLSNRHYAMSWLENRLAVTKAASMAVIMFDIDRFKRFNDTYGHDKGDKVLRHLATQLQTLAGPNDLTARLEEDELLLILTDKPLEAVEAALALLFEAVAQAVPLHERPDLRYICHAGVALALPGEMPRNLLNRANQALLQAKRDGRNNYIIAE